MAITKREYLDPRWTNEDKKTIECTIRLTYENDEFKDHKAFITDPNGDNTDWKAIMETYGADKLDEDMAKVKEHQKKKQEKREADRKRQEERMKQEGLFARKMEIFKMDEVKNSTNRPMKTKIRRAKTETEAIVLAAVLVQQEGLSTDA